MRQWRWGLGAGALVGVWCVVWSYTARYDQPLRTQTFFDRSGHVIGTLHPEYDGLQIWTPLEQFPRNVIAQTLAAEDRWFWRHGGVNPIALGKAAWSNVLHGRVVRGGSTITQQLAKLMIQAHDDAPHARSLGNKLRETFLAFGLEIFHSKQWILERYLNTAYYGEHCYGIAAASAHYFGKALGSLNDRETAWLVHLPQMPGKVWSRHVARKNVPSPLEGEGQGEGDSHRTSFTLPLPPCAPLGCPFQGGGKIIGRHFMEYVAETSVKISDTQHTTITTTLDLDLQTRVEHAVRVLLAPRLAEDPLVTAAVIVIDVATGDVRAMVGSRAYENDDIAGKFNAAVALRQPGSALKPFTYFAAFARGFGPDTLVPDEPTTFTVHGDPDAANYLPQNFDHHFHGLVTMRAALANSYNVPAVVTLNQIGLGPYHELLRHFGFTSFTHSPLYYGLAMTLGSGEVSLLELTNAYAALARGGASLPYRLRASDPRGLAVDVVPNAATYAHAITDILSDNHARRKAFGFNIALDSDDTPIAVKTGTSYAHHDNWTIGYTREVAVGVWVGHADHSPLPGTTGASGAAPIWRAVMEMLVRGCEHPLPGPPPEGEGTKNRDPITAARTQHNTDTAHELANDADWRITSPAGNATYRTRPFLPPSAQHIEARALIHSNSATHALFWYLDGASLGTTTDNNARLWISPTLGAHQLLVCDDRGRSERITFHVEAAE